MNEITSCLNQYIFVEPVWKINNNLAMHLNCTACNWCLHLITALYSTHLNKLFCVKPILWVFYNYHNFINPKIKYYSCGTSNNGHAVELKCRYGSVVVIFWPHNQQKIVWHFVHIILLHPSIFYKKKHSRI